MSICWKYLKFKVSMKMYVTSSVRVVVGSHICCEKRWQSSWSKLILPSKCPFLVLLVFPKAQLKEVLLDIFMLGFSTFFSWCLLITKQQKSSEPNSVFREISVFPFLWGWVWWQQNTLFYESWSSSYNALKRLAICGTVLWKRRTANVLDLLSDNMTTTYNADSFDFSEQREFD